MFGDEIGDALEAMTHDPGTPYEEYIHHIASNPISRAVKIADLTHNMDLTRLGHEPTDEDRERMEKYKRAMRILQDASLVKENGGKAG